MFDWTWVNDNLNLIGRLTLEHLVQALLPALAALLVSLPLGYLVHRSGRVAPAVLAVLRVVCSVPALALLVLVLVVLGRTSVDRLSIMVALTIYSTAFLVGSVVTGLRSVPAGVKRSATALGYGPLRRVFGVELPLAMPAVFAGLRRVTVSNLVLVAVGAVVGSGALGRLFLGFDLSAPGYTPVIVGLVLILVLALLADVVIRLVRRGALPWTRRTARAASAGARPARPGTLVRVR